MYGTYTNLEVETAKRQRPSGICYLLAFPAIFLMLIFKIIPFIGAIILPFKEYTPAKGITGSPWVGMDNFREVLTSFHFQRVFTNTLILKFENILACMLVALVLALLVSLIQVRWLRKFFTTLFLVPYFIPTAVFSYIAFHMMSMEGPGFLFLFHTDSLINPQTFRTTYIAIEVVKNIGIPLILAVGAIYAHAGLTGERNHFLYKRFIPALKAVGLFALIQLSSLVITDFELLDSFLNPLAYETFNTLATYSYRTGLVSARYSSQAVIWMIQFIVQLVMAFPIYWLIKSFFTKGIFDRFATSKESMASINGLGTPAGLSLGIIMCLVAALFLFMPAVLSLVQIAKMPAEGAETFKNVSIGKAFANYIPLTLIGVIINALITVLLAYPLTVPNLPGRGVYKVFLIVVLCMGHSGIHEYLFYRTLGAVNTYFPYIFTGMFTVVNVFVLKEIYNARYTQVEERTAYGWEGDGASFFKKYLPGVLRPLLGLAGLQFIAMWNSYAPSQLWYILDPSRFSPVMMLKKMMMAPQGEAYMAMTPLMVRTAFWVSLPSLVIGILLVVFIGHEIFISQMRKS